ncbi:MAG TPA: nicotinate-nucleotide adenylyltransferase [Fimbriimonadaceae bacterium]|nr:nicotinate-nucleotide adenylyltransferase [Fimbriimonadaceae bacterium]
MKIGIFGGTFDPPHLAHLELARSARVHLELDEVLWVPAGKNPLKTARAVASGKHRLRMTQLAIEGEPGMAALDLEITRDGPSYTVDTLNDLSVVMPGEYWLILGADSLRTFGQWKAPERILKLARLAVAVRPPMTVHKLEAFVDASLLSHVDWIPMEESTISSTEIRHTLERGRPIDPWVNGNVLKYISEHNLYRGR